MILLALFPLLGQMIPDGPFSYLGQSQNREEIVVDPHNSPLLDQAYDSLIHSLPSNEKQVLEKVIDFVRTELFTLSTCSVHQVETFIKGQPSNVLALDDFLEQKMGVCRHIALTTTLLLHRLVQDGYIEGKVIFMRENLKQTRHAWTLLVNDRAVWHIDAYWNVLENAQDQAGLERLIHRYQINVWPQYQTQPVLVPYVGQDPH